LSDRKQKSALLRPVQGSALPPRSQRKPVRYERGSGREQSRADENENIQSGNDQTTDSLSDKVQTSVPVKWLIENKTIVARKVFGNKIMVRMPAITIQQPGDVEAYLRGGAATESFPHAGDEDEDFTEY
jgi:hypothetical protein